ncbi:MAG TPA: hypothetical protein VG734_26140 [Lacunisphaera sp.]|nr:hypothetical protein [Lacunisphaera sp.]
MTGPLFKWFGSKWLSAKRLPPPEHELVIEPFAGSAGYSLRHASRRVQIWEDNFNLLILWAWLIGPARTAEILEIPLGTPVGTDIRTLGLSQGQSLLLKHWQRTNNYGDCWTVSPWGNLPGQWTANTRARVADEVHEVKHWKLAAPDFSEVATYFFDAPYQLNYRYGARAFDYQALAVRVRALPAGSQVIVCEARCQKTGAAPDWLPFVDWESRITSRRKATENHHSREMIYLRTSTGKAA